MVDVDNENAEELGMLGATYCVFPNENCRCMVLPSFCATAVSQVSPTSGPMRLFPFAMGYVQRARLQKARKYTVATRQDGGLEENETRNLSAFFSIVFWANKAGTERTVSGGCRTTQGTSVVGAEDICKVSAVYQVQHKAE